MKLMTHGRDEASQLLPGVRRDTLKRKGGGLVEVKEKILTALANPKFAWRTAKGVSRETGIDTDTVVTVIEGMPDLVIRSRVPDAEGRPLYTTRAHYKDTHSSFERFVDLFKATST